MKSKTSDDIIIAFISSSSVSYALSADEIYPLERYGGFKRGDYGSDQAQETGCDRKTEQPAVAAQSVPIIPLFTGMRLFNRSRIIIRIWTYPTYIDLGWGWGGGGRYYHRGGSGHYRGGYSTGHVSGGGSPRGWSGYRIKICGKQ